VRRGGDLTGEVALVTGALGRLGPIWIEGLLDAGARVVGLDLVEAKIPDAFARLLDRHGEERLRLVRADVTDRTSLTHAHEWCGRAGWRPSVLLNNAGIDQPPTVLPRNYRVEDIPAELFREVFEVNVLGAFQAIQSFGPDMVARGRGSIINVGSLYATIAPDQRFYDHLPSEPPFLKPPAYGASKAAVVNLTRYFAALWGRHGVRVNALSPGGVMGGQDQEFLGKYVARVPLGRMAEPSDLAGPLIFLASEAARYVTGINLKVDGGFTVW
jgi:NAD(P)-dependent dehydrogenase (short-subunit alcohol dehydrogenase family)